MGTEWGQPMTDKWHSTKYPGIRYREHPIRRHGVKKDRYFTIRYQRDGNRKEEGLGWASEGWTFEKVLIELAAIKKAHITGEGANSLQEKREAEKKRRKTEKVTQERLKIKNTFFETFFYEKYLPIAQTDKKESTYKTETELFKNWIKPVIGKIPIRDIHPFHIEKVKKNILDAKRSPRTVQYTLAIIRQIWNTARREGFVNTDSPTKLVKIPTFDNKRQRFLSHEEADLLLKKLKNRSEPLSQITLLSLHCGLRASEIFNLTWGDIFLEKGFITLRDTKSGKNDFAYMTDDIKEMFKKMNRGLNHELIFENRNGGKIKSISNTFDRVIKECGFNNNVTDRKQKVVFHSLRHTYASWLVENGTDLYTVQKLMRHSSSKMTERYAHLGENTLQKAVKRFASTIRNKKKANVVELK